MPQLPPDCIRLSAGYPAPALVPVDEMATAAASVLATEGHWPLQYLGSQAMSTLRELIRDRLGQRGVTVGEGELLVTAGAAQAIDLCARVLLDETAYVAVEAPTYMEALETFRNYTDHIIDYPVDAGGLCVDELADDLARRLRQGLPLPRLLYTVPSFHNPTGTTLRHDRRLHLVELAEQYDFLIVEDDAYGELAFAERPTMLRQLDWTGRVLSIGSFSKVIGPGLRVGWVAGAAPLLATLSRFKKDLDHPFVQAVTATYLQAHDLDARIMDLRTAYLSRRDALVEALQRHMPTYVTWHVPTGGYFVWLHTPGVDTAILLPHALQAGVSYVPGRHFFVNADEGTAWLRLSFSYADIDDLAQGVQRLGELLSEGVRQ